MLSRRLVAQDLAWAGVILLLAAIVGIGQQWQLVRLSLNGALASHLDEQRQQRRQVEFQGVQTLNLSQAYAIFQGGRRCSWMPGTLKNTPNYTLPGPSILPRIS